MALIITVVMGNVMYSIAALLSGFHSYVGRHLERLISSLAQPIIVLLLIFVASKLFNTKQKLLITNQASPKLRVFLILLIFYAAMIFLSLLLGTYTIPFVSYFSISAILDYSDRLLIPIISIVILFLTSIIEILDFIFLVTFGMIFLFDYQHKTIETDGDVDIYPEENSTGNRE